MRLAPSLILLESLDCFPGVREPETPSGITGPGNPARIMNRTAHDNVCPPDGMLQVRHRDRRGSAMAGRPLPGGVGILCLARLSVLRAGVMALTRRAGGSAGGPWPSSQ